MEWFRSVHGAPTHKKWLAIARRCQQPVPVVVAVAWALMDYASRQKDRGSVVGFDTEDQAAYLYIETDDVDAVLQAMEDKGWLSNGRITSWDDHQTKREDASAERTKAWRERMRTQRDAPVTQRDAPDTDTDLEKIERLVAPRGSRLPKDWTLPLDWELWAKQERPDINPIAEGLKFRDYWAAKAGAGGVKLDWLATWRNWIRNASGPRHGKRTDGPSDLEIIADVTRQLAEQGHGGMG